MRSYKVSPEDLPDSLGHMLFLHMAGSLSASLSCCDAAREPSPGNQNHAVLIFKECLSPGCKRYTKQLLRNRSLPAAVCSMKYMPLIMFMLFTFTSIILRSSGLGQEVAVNNLFTSFLVYSSIKYNKYYIYYILNI